MNSVHLEANGKSVIGNEFTRGFLNVFMIHFTGSQIKTNRGVGVRADSGGFPCLSACYPRLV